MIKGRKNGKGDTKRTAGIGKMNYYYDDYSLVIIMRLDWLTPDSTHFFYFDKFTSHLISEKNALRKNLKFNRFSHGFHTWFLKTQNKEKIDIMRSVYAQILKNAVRKWHSNEQIVRCVWMDALITIFRRIIKWLVIIGVVWDREQLNYQSISSFPGVQPDKVDEKRGKGANHRGERARTRVNTQTYTAHREQHKYW